MTILEIFQKLHDESYSITEKNERDARVLAIWQTRAQFVEAHASFDDSFGSNDPQTTEVVIRSLVALNSAYPSLDDAASPSPWQPHFVAA